ELTIRDATSAPSSAAAGRALWAALETALSPPRAEGGLQLRLFAIPILLVTGGNANAVIPGVVPAIDELKNLFEEAGALGQAKNFGLSNALTSLTSLEAVSWIALHRIATVLSSSGLELLELPPAPIRVDPGEQLVHLRFLAGAALTPANAPSFAETAGDIGRWGMLFTRVLAAQIGVPELSLLPLPRPPTSILGAARVGRFSANEIGLQLFLSNALRQARLRAGDPEVSIATYSDATIRVRLSSAFDATLDQTYRWPLAPNDDLGEVENSIFGLLAEVHLERIEVVDTVIHVNGQE
ncbi:MAG: hypothetical protein ACREUQ_08180, partial [Burkholderiales bacterium]